MNPTQSNTEKLRYVENALDSVAQECMDTVFTVPEDDNWLRLELISIAQFSSAVSRRINAIRHDFAEKFINDQKK